MLFSFFNIFHNRWKAWAKADKFKKIPLKEDDAAHIEALTTRLAKATEKKQSAKSDEDRLSAAALLEDAKAKIKLVSFMFCCKLWCIFSLIACRW